MSYTARMTAMLCVSIYLAIGVMVSAALSQTPYADNGWILMTLCWPLCIYVLFFG